VAIILSLDAPDHDQDEEVHAAIDKAKAEDKIKSTMSKT
jgi:hypothetical protein